MASNLEQLLGKKGISKKEYARFLGLSEKSVYNKLVGKTEFSYPEVLKTSTYLFPEYKESYIFAKTCLDDSA